MKNKKNIIFCIILSFISLISFRIDLLVEDIEGGFFRRYLDALSVSGGQIEDLFLFMGFVVLFNIMINVIGRQWSKDSAGKNNGRKRRWDLIYSIIPGSIYSLCMIVGDVIERSGTFTILFKDTVQVAKFCTVFSGYTILFSTIILFLYFCINNFQWNKDSALIKDTLYGKFVLWFEKVPFWHTFLVLCILSVPYIVISYPGIVQGDYESMLLQGFNVPDSLSNVLVPLDPEVYLNNHHTFMYTLFVHACVMVGKILFDSYNIGLFLVGLIQFIFATAVISYLIDYFVSLQINSKVYIVALLYYILSPRIRSYLFLISKDVLYSFTLLFLIVFLSKNLLFKKCETETFADGNVQASISSKKTGILFIYILLMGALIVVLRNEGRYVIVVWLALMACIHKPMRKRYIVTMLTLMAFVFLLSNIIMPYYKITPGSMREMISVPFQQTARYVLYHDDEVTEYQREIIDKVIVYDTLAERYIPTKTDPVKNEYNEYSTRDDIKKYFGVWYDMFKKHPTLYIDALLNKNFYYFYFGNRYASYYPYSYSREMMKIGNDKLQNVGMDIHYPTKIEWIRGIHEGIRESVYEIPVLNIFKCTALYVWILIFLFFYFLWSKKYLVICIWIPLILCLGVAFLAPPNGDYFRYAYVIVVCLPVTVILGMAYKRIICDRFN